MDTIYNEQNIRNKDYTMRIYQEIISPTNHYVFRFLKLDILDIKINISKCNYTFLNKYRDLLNLNKSKRLQVFKNNISTFRKIKSDYINSTRDRLPMYLKEKFKLKTKPSNGYLKMFEILTEKDLIKPNKDTLFTVHLAEAPGNFIAATRHKYMTINPKGKHYWLANSLNPKIVKHGLPDMYGYIKNNPNNWLFGKDNTGNILEIDNIKDIIEKVNIYKTKNNLKIDIITGDLGVDAQDELGIEKQKEFVLYLQKLDLSQAITCILLADIGSSCVIKHFICFNEDLSVTDDAADYFVSLLFLYYIYYDEVNIIKPFSSNKTSTEFYVCCKRFRGSRNGIDLLTVLKNYKLNHSLFNKKDIPDSFLVQVDKVMENLTAQYIDSVENIIFLYGCMNDPGSLITEQSGCKYILK